MKKQFAFLTILMTAASLTACAAKTPADQSAPIPAETAAVTAAADHSEPEAGSDHGDWLSKACGTWIIDMDGDQCELRIESSDEAYFRLTIDATHDFYFDADESFHCSGNTVPKDGYSFENGKFAFSHNGRSILEMEKLDGSDSIFGEFKLTGGSYQEIYEGSDTVIDSIVMTVKEDETLATADQVLTLFALTADTITMNPGSTDEAKTAPYVIEDDTLKINPGTENERDYPRKQ